MSNGYKPAPYNLSTVSVTPKMTRLVEQLAENAHNVWARDRMEQGWTYGLAEVNHLLSLQNLIFFVPVKMLQMYQIGLELGCLDYIVVS